VVVDAGDGVAAGTSIGEIVLPAPGGVGYLLPVGGVPAAAAATESSVGIEAAEVFLLSAVGPSGGVAELADPFEGESPGALVTGAAAFAIEPFRFFPPAGGVLPEPTAPPLPDEAVPVAAAGEVVATAASGALAPSTALAVSVAVFTGVALVVVTVAASAAAEEPAAGADGLGIVR
jgi:hypothetical protein